MLNIVVTVKQVLDPEAPVSTFKIDPEANRPVPIPGIPQVLNPYDENALEAALKLKDVHHCKVVVVSLGAKLAKAVLRKCLAAGADDLFLLEDELFETSTQWVECSSHLRDASFKNGPFPSVSYRAKSSQIRKRNEFSLEKAPHKDSFYCPALP